MNKLNQIKIFCHIVKPHVLCISETWIQQDINDIEIKINGFNHYRCDRKSCLRGGGVIVYVSTDIRFKVEKIEMNNNVIECVLLKFKCEYSKPIYLMTVYNPPNGVKEFKLEFMSDIKEYISEETIIIGDFNIDLNNNLCQKWLKHSEDNGFFQMTSQNTRVSDNSSSLLDHIYTNRLNNVSNYGVIETSFADHFITFIGRKINGNHSYEKKCRYLIYYNDWKNINFKMIDKKLNYIILNSNDVNKNCNDFICKIHEISREEIRLKTKFVKKQTLEKWIDSEVLDLINRKNKIQKLIENERKQNIFNQNNFEYYKKIRNEKNILIWRKKKSFYTKEIIKCGKNTAKMWRILRPVVPTKRSKNSNEVNNEFSAEMLNRFFTEETKKIVLNEYNDTNEANIIQNDCLIDKYIIPKINESTVSKIINNFLLKKSRGSDGLSMRFIKCFKFSLILNLISIINMSIEKSKFPTLWKIAKLIPIHKNGNKSDPNNYRPISLLSIFSKIIEKYIEKSFRDFLINKNILSEMQFGFKANHSTIDTLISIKSDLSVSMNKNMKTVLMTFDLKKAFDCVDHKILISKLKKICENTTLSWFELYLQNRYTFVSFNKKLSTPKPINISVPQGGCLAPLLFIYYMNDIQELQLEGQVYLFADDLTLVIKAKTYTELQNKIDFDLKTIGDWLQKNKLVLNYPKSKYVIMASPHERSIQNINPKINGRPLERVFSVKILGIEIDNCLRFDAQIDKLIKDLNSRFALLSRLKNFLPEKTLNFIYKSIIRPKLEYGCIVWGHTYDIHIERLVKIQKRFGRLITNSDYSIRSENIFTKSNWLSIKNAIKYQSVLYIFKSINGYGSNYTKRLFEFNKNRTNARNGRDRLHINIPLATKNYMKNSILCKGVEFWNHLPIRIRSAPDLKNFKQSLNTFDFNSI